METSEVTPALHLHPAHYYDRGPWGGSFFLQGMGWINWLPRELALGDLSPGCHTWLQDGAGQSGQECGYGVS